MCGIIGYLGYRRNRGLQILLKALLRMEYRGYDSAGLSTVVNDDGGGGDGGKRRSFFICKAAGRISGLISKLNKIMVQIHLYRNNDLNKRNDDNVITVVVIADKNDSVQKLIDRAVEEIAIDYRLRVSVSNIRLGSSPFEDSVICSNKKQNLSEFLSSPHHNNTGNNSNNNNDNVWLDANIIETLSPNLPIPTDLSNDSLPEKNDKNDHPFIGIAHTRWATHGEANEINCHPHVSNDGNIMIVHNGIIENRDELKTMLIEKGYTFYSETDSEVVPVLMEYIHKTQANKDFFTTVVQTIACLRGAFGLAVMFLPEDKLYGVRLGSPLCVGIGEGEYFLASEPSAFLGYTNKQVDLDDYEIVTITTEGQQISHFVINDSDNDNTQQQQQQDQQDQTKRQKLLDIDDEFHYSSSTTYSPTANSVNGNKLGITTNNSDSNGSFNNSNNNNGNNGNNNNSNNNGNCKTLAITKQKVGHRVVTIPFDLEAVRKGHFRHFMLKEIHDQPNSLRNTFGGKINHTDAIHITVPNPLKKITLLACGTSWHSALIGRYIIENDTGISCNVEYASEYLTKRCLLDKGDLVIAISQSGETADTREAVKIAISHGATVAGIVNVVGSQIARLCKQGMYLHAGPEIGVASTKAFSSQVVALNMLSAKLSNSQSYREKISAALLRLPELVQNILSDSKITKMVEDISELIKDSQNALYLGRGIDFPVALEGALKLKEISYIHAEGYPAGEMKHGPIALIDKDMPVFCVVGSDPEIDGHHNSHQHQHGVYEKVLSNMNEVYSRKGRIITITDRDDPELNRLSVYVIKVPHILYSLSPVLKVIPLQLIAYSVALRRGLDPDKPRNLAKSVTVI